MWCTGCHTAFDWNTGRKVVSGQLHNPHWLEYQRSQNPQGGQAQRAPGDVPCGGLVSLRDIRIWKDKLPKNKEGIALGKMVQEQLYVLVEHITNNEVRGLREQCQTIRDFEKQRVQYIVGEKTKEELAKHIYRSHRKVQKNTELLHIFELLSVVGIDMFNRITANGPMTALELQKLTEKQVDEYDAWRIHCNGLFAVISNTYGQVVPHIIPNWGLKSYKFTGGSVLPIGVNAL